MSGGTVGGDLDDMRSIADALDHTASELWAIARDTSGATVSGALLGTIPFSPGTAAVAEKELLEAAVPPGLIAAQAEALALFLRTKAELLEIAGSGLLRAYVDFSTESLLGLVEGVSGLVATAEMISKLSMHRMLVDPIGWARDYATLGEGLWWGVTHPVEFGKEIIDWDTWTTNPGRAYGRLIPDLALAAATWGAGPAISGGSRGARAASGLERGAMNAEGRTATRLPDPSEWPVGRRLADGGLKAHDDRGGHTIKKHVGKTDAELSQRFADEPKLSDASTFPNVAVADDAVATAIIRNERFIAKEFESDDMAVLSGFEVGRPTGRIIARGGTLTHSSKVTVVLVRDDSPLGYHVLTAYPAR